MELHELADALAVRVEELCTQLLPAGRRIGTQWIVGNVFGDAGDSCYVELTGPKQGLWYDHAAGEGGDLLALVAQNQTLPIGRAAAWARQFLARSIPSSTATAPTPPSRTATAPPPGHTTTRTAQSTPTSSGSTSRTVPRTSAPSGSSRPKTNSLTRSTPATGAGRVGPTPTRSLSSTSTSSPGARTTPS